MTRLALIWPQTSGLWTAGNLYFENLLTSISLSGHTDDVRVIEPEGGSYSRGVHTAPPVPVSTYAQRPEPTTRAQVLARLVRRQLKLPNREVDAAVRESGVAVAFGEVDLRAKFPVPWVGWIPDFQHVHYPQFFSADQLRERDDIYGRLAARATLVLLSSEDALQDFRRFAPSHADKGRVASFVSLFPESYFESSPAPVVAKYGISGEFVVVPNQWWQHKNHEVAIRAAALLRDSGRPLTWVVTGALADYRNDRHISRLLQLIAELGLRQQFVLLGALPREEQVQLMRAASCIVQPSLFEGWSTVVEDAKTLGQRLVVSDLAVHREQAPPAALFFDPASPQDLAEKLAAMLDGATERPDEAASLQASLERARVFGDRFYTICAEAAGAHGGR